MDLYTVTSAWQNGAPNLYDKETVIDNYESLIWTEKYIDPGEIELKLPGTIQNFDLVAPGTLLGLSASPELMLIDTREVKDGSITAKGQTLERFLEQRETASATITGTPGQIAGQIVDNMIDIALPASSGFETDGTGIPRLVTGSLDGPVEVITDYDVNRGPAYDELLRLAQTYNLNFRIVTATGADDLLELHFQTYTGRDLTRDGEQGRMVRFSPNLDNFAEVGEVLSHVDFVNVVVMNVRQDLSIGPVLPLKVSKVPNGNDIYQPFKERIRYYEASDITEATLGSGTDYEKLQQLYSVMRAQARQKLRDLGPKTHAIDGEIPPNSKYQYIPRYVDLNVPSYRLGDLVEVGGPFGGVVKATVAEHIFAADAEGTRYYPGVKVLDDPVNEPPEIAT